MTIIEICCDIKFNSDYIKRYQLLHKIKKKMEMENKEKNNLSDNNKNNAILIILKRCEI